MTSKLHRGKLDRVQFDRLKFDRGKRVRGKFDRDTFEKGKFDVKISLLKTLDGGKLIEADTNGWGGPNNHLWSQSTGRQHRPPLTSKHLRTFPPNCRIHCCFPCVFHGFSTILIYFDGLLFFQRLFLMTVTFVALLQRHPCEDCQKCQAMPCGCWKTRIWMVIQETAEPKPRLATETWSFGIIMAKSIEQQPLKQSKMF